MLDHRFGEQGTVGNEHCIRLEGKNAILQKRELLSERVGSNAKVQDFVAHPCHIGRRVKSLLEEFRDRLAVRYTGSHYVRRSKQCDSVGPIRLRTSALLVAHPPVVRRKRLSEKDDVRVRHELAAEKIVPVSICGRRP